MCRKVSLWRSIRNVILVVAQSRMEKGRSAGRSSFRCPGRSRKCFRRSIRKYWTMTKSSASIEWVYCGMYDLDSLITSLHLRAVISHRSRCTNWLLPGLLSSTIRLLHTPPCPNYDSKIYFFSSRNDRAFVRFLHAYDPMRVIGIHVSSS